jgi:hypothetical protein
MWQGKATAKFHAFSIHIRFKHTFSVSFSCSRSAQYSNSYRRHTRELLTLFRELVTTGYPIITATITLRSKRVKQHNATISEPHTWVAVPLFSAEVYVDLFIPPARSPPILTVLYNFTSIQVYTILHCKNYCKTHLSHTVNNNVLCLLLCFEKYCSGGLINQYTPKHVDTFK